MSGFTGAGMGGLTFMTCHNILTHKMYADSKYQDLDFRLKNMLIYVCSDLLASLSRLPFETRKQLVQMSNTDISLNLIARNSYYGLVPLIVRDTSFRFMILGSYYSTTQIEHRPVLKFTIPQIMDFMRSRRELGYDDKLQDMQSIFYDYHSYSIKTSYPMRLTMLILANLLATAITNPIDVCLSKILTQNTIDGKVKYTGLIQALNTVYKEEGKHKFLSGLHPRFMFNLMNGFLFLFVYDRFTHFINTVYE